MPEILFGAGPALEESLLFASAAVPRRSSDHASANDEPVQMMSKSLTRRLEHQEREHAPKRRIRYIWQHWGESDEAVQARIRAMTDRGELRETDEITIFSWLEPEGGWPPKDPNRWSGSNHQTRAEQAEELCPDYPP